MHILFKRMCDFGMLKSHKQTASCTVNLRKRDMFQLCLRVHNGKSKNIRR